MNQPFPPKCWRPLFEEYRDLMAPTTEAADAFHFVSFFAGLGMHVGRGAYIYIAKPIYPNAQVVLVGESYDDKKSTAITKAFAEVGTGAPWDPATNQHAIRMLHGIGSAEALLDILAGRHKSDATITRQRVALVINEFSSLMQKARQKALGNLPPFINECYDCPDVLELPSRTSMTIRAEKPFLCILAGSTQSWLENSISSTDIMSGFANRFLFIIGEPKAPNALPPPPDQNKLDAIKQKLLSIEQQYSNNTAPTAFLLSSDAEQLWCGFYSDWRNKKWAGDLVSTVVKRTPEYIIKLSLIYSITENCTAVSKEQLEAAIAFGWWAAECAQSIFSDFSETRQGKVESRIKHELGKGAQTKREVRLAIGSWCDTEEFNRGWYHLEKCNEIQINTSVDSKKELWELA